MGISWINKTESNKNSIKRNYPHIFAYSIIINSHFLSSICMPRAEGENWGQPLDGEKMRRTSIFGSLLFTYIHSLFQLICHYSSSSAYVEPWDQFIFWSGSFFIPFLIHSWIQPPDPENEEWKIYINHWKIFNTNKRWRSEINWRTKKILYYISLYNFSI